MARHNKIIRKRSGKDELLEDPAEASKKWLEVHGWKITAVAVTLFVLVLGGVAAGYYKKVTSNSAQARLYEAAAKEQKAMAGAGAMKDAITEYENLIASGGSGGAVIQARMSVARLYLDGGEPAKAADHFVQAARAAGENTLVGELCQAGLAKALAGEGKTAEAEAKLQALSTGAKFYPRSEAIIDLAFVQAAAGKSQEAAKTLARIKNAEGGLIVPIPVDDIIGRMERGDIAEGLKKLAEARAVAATEKVAKTAETSVHSTPAPAVPPVAPAPGGGK